MDKDTVNTVNTVYSTLDGEMIRDLKMISQIDLIDSIPIEKRAKPCSTKSITANESIVTNSIESKPGNRWKKGEIICISDTRAATVHIKLWIGTEDSEYGRDQTIPVIALHDSGCSKSIMSKKLYEQLQQTGNTQIYYDPRYQAVKVASGEVQKILGVANIRLHFVGENKCNKSFLLDVIVHEGLDEEFFLGRDFTGSDAKALETNDHIYLTYEQECYLDSVEKNLKNKKLCKVPLYSVKEAPITISNNKTVVIPPLSPLTITCHVTQKKGNRIPLKPKGSIDFHIENVIKPRLETLPAMYTLENPSQIEITLFNDTIEDYHIEPNEEIAEIKLWGNMVECHRMEVKALDVDEELQIIHNENGTIKSNTDKIIKLNRPIFIEDDDTLTEEEKEIAFLQYMKNGYHHPSMTKIIEEREAITEYKLEKTDPISDEEWSKQFDLAHLTDFQKQKALETFAQNKQAFSTHVRDLGCTDMVEMDIELTTNQNLFQQYRPVPYALKEQIVKILDQLLQYGIIRECDEPSPIVSNLLACKKKDDSVRILLDGRLLNIYSKKMAQNQVSQNELETHLSDADMASTVDLSDAFFQLPLALRSQAYTAFYSPFHGKRFCFTRCPQGLKNSPLFLRLLMDKLFGDMTENVIHYADDILISTKSSSFEQHLNIIDKVLQRIIMGKIKIRPQKINLARDHIEFLGMVWTKGKLSIPKAKTLAFQNLPSPDTPKKAKSIICALSYYRKFVPNFAQLSQPIMELTTLHPKEFKWTEWHENLFRRLIKAICKSASRYLPNPNKPYYVQTDASAYCGAGKLFQKDDEGNELLIACVSKTFSKTERAYSTIKKEVLALLYTLRTMDYYIRFTDKLTILTDAQGILFLSMCKESQGILLRFSLELSKYQAEIVHVPGKDNETADVLSRHHPEIEKIQQEEMEQKPMTESQAMQILEKLKIPSGTRFTKEEVATLLEVPSLPNPVPKKARKSTAKEGVRVIKNTPKMVAKRKVKEPKTSNKRPGIIRPIKVNTIYVTKWYPGTNTSRAKRQTNKAIMRSRITEVRTVRTMSYNDFKTVSKAVLTGILTPREFKQAQAQDPFCQRILNSIQQKKSFVMIDGLLFFKVKDVIKLVLPNSLLDLVITSKHFSVFGLHFSKTRVERDINARYYVPHNILSEKLKLLRDNCLICQFNKTEKEDHVLRATDYVHAPRATWGIDLIPNLPMSDNGYKAALLAVDLFTGYIQLCPIKDRTTKTLIEAIQKTIINPFGIPKYLRTDEEPGMFRSQEFYDFLKPLGTKFLPTSVGAPWANSNAERSIKTIKQAMRNYFLQEKVEDKWDEYAHFFTYTHNRSASIYGFAPEQLMFGERTPNASDLLQFWPGARNQSEYMEKLVPLAEEQRQKAMDRSNKKKDKDRSYKNVHRVAKQFRLGQIVAHRQLQLATGSAMGMKPKHTGPYIITELNPDGCSATIEHMYTGHLMQAHFTNLQVISFHAGIGNRVDANFDDRLIDMLSEKSTLLSKTRAHLDISTDLEDQPVMEYETEEDEREIELANEVDLNHSINPPSSEFGSLTDGELNLSAITSLADITCSVDEDNQFEDSKAYQLQIDSQETQDNSLIQSLINSHHQCIICDLENNVITSENIENHPFIVNYKKQLAKEIEKQLREQESERTPSSLSHTVESPNRQITPYPTENGLKRKEIDIQFEPDENRVSTPYPELNNSNLSYLSD
jgi:hypothetical protein